ncbi:MAG: L-histidine N(alpha)-methyltransferase [Burkholderiaceae bacterium]|nr:L-histidine N(alpha)-methyltransferase [Burkholderiaceae bacterium]
MNDPASPRRQPRFTHYAQPATDIATGIVAGLRCEPPSIAPRYFYDALGSRLFEAICELPEYYPTRTEAALLAENGRQIAEAAGAGCTLIDLGAGDCEKAARLFDLMQPAQYAALDISADFLRERLDCLQDRFPQLDIIGVALDFAADLQLPESVAAARRLFFYPGSSIGNFSPDEARGFLRRVQGLAGAGGQLLIGVDLVKPSPILDAAYDDALGVTAAFNRNVLIHVNRLAGTDFDIRDWRHVAFFDAASARIEMHLEARRDVIVRIPDEVPLRMAAGARIHTENSWKYTVEGFEALLRAAGFAQTRCWTDARGWFALFLARA